MDPCCLPEITIRQGFAELSRDDVHQKVNNWFPIMIFPIMLLHWPAYSRFRP